MKLRPRAQLTWTADGVPFAESFGDIYYSKHGGLAETRAVFLDALDLPEFWRGRACSVFGELGFGAGLNALALWDLWTRHREPGAILHFLSIEGFPLDRDDAARALAAFPELSGLAHKLLAKWPCRASGFQRLWFPEDGFCLTLIHEDAKEGLPFIDGPVDGWLLDGFAPSRNPDMWSPDLLSEIARASAPGARAATYSVAGSVRRNLTGAGFNVQRAPGFGAKRERLAATYQGATLEIRRAKPRSALIIGGGIAGACAAAALKVRGLKIALIDRDGLASAASGNPAGIVSPRLDAGEDAPGQFLRAAYLYAVGFYGERAPDAFHQCGIVRAELDAAKAAKLSADPNLPGEWMQAAAPQNEGLDAPAAFWLPQAGLLEPARAIARLTQDCTIITGAAIAAIEREGDLWRARDANGGIIAEADIAIVTAGAGVAKLLRAEYLALDGRRGAISLAPSSAPPMRAISAGAYAFQWGADVLFGATFDPAALDDPAAPLDAHDHERNLTDLRAVSPSRAAGLTHVTQWRGRASVRVTTPDQLPVAGGVPDRVALEPSLDKLRHGAIAERDIETPVIEGLFVIAALGSRGLTTAPILGEYVACLACCEPAPLPRSQRRALDPARFVLRMARRNQN